MVARAAAIALCLAALAAAGRALAEDNPSCAQYQEPMAYNACLARYGPKADIGPHPGGTEPQRAGQEQTYQGEVKAPGPSFRRWPHAQRLHGRVHMEFRVR